MPADRVAIALTVGLREDKCRFFRSGAAENQAGVRDIVTNILTNPEGRNKSQAIEIGAENRLPGQSPCVIRPFHPIGMVSKANNL